MMNVNLLNFIILSVIMLSVLKLNVVMVNVAAPRNKISLSFFMKLFFLLRKFLLSHNLK